MSGPSAEGPAPAPPAAAEAGAALGDEARDVILGVLAEQAAGMVPPYRRDWIATEIQRGLMLLAATKVPILTEDAWAVLVDAFRPYADRPEFWADKVRGPVAALVAAAKADRADLLRSIGEMETKHRAACASWERRLREQVAAAEERGAAAERERCADRLQQVIEERAWHTAAARDPLVVKTWYLDRLVVEWTGDSARVPTLAADYDTDAANSADAVARGQS